MRVLTLALIGAFFVTGCSGGGGNFPIAAVAAAAPLGHTSRVESLPGGRCPYFLENASGKTITYAANGAAQHDFVDGKTAIDKVPVPKIGGIHSEICRVLIDPAAQDFYYRSVTAYNQATMNLFVVLGGIAATTVITSGLAGVVLGSGGLLAFYL